MSQEEAVKDTIFKVETAITFKNDLLPLHKMYIIELILGLYRQGIYTSAEALTKIKQLITNH